MDEENDVYMNPVLQELDPRPEPDPPVIVFDPRNSGDDDVK